MLGDRYYFEGRKDPEGWQRSMMFIYEKDGMPDGVISANAFANLKRPLWQRSGVAEYRMSFWSCPNYLDESFDFSFRDLSNKAVEAENDFEFITAKADILLRGVYRYVNIIPSNQRGLSSINYGNNVQVTDPDRIEEDLAEIMARSEAFKNQVKITP